MESGIYTNSTARDRVKEAIGAGHHSIVQIANKTKLSIDDVYSSIESLLLYAEIFWVRKTDQWWLRRPNTMVVNTYDEAIERVRYYLRYEDTERRRSGSAWSLCRDFGEVRTRDGCSTNSALASKK